MQILDKLSIHLRNLSKNDIELIETVMKKTGCRTHSKALLEAFSGYLLYQRRYYDLEKRYISLVNKYKK